MQAPHTRRSPWRTSRGWRCSAARCAAALLPLRPPRTVLDPAHSPRGGARRRHRHPRLARPAAAELAALAAPDGAPLELSRPTRAPSSARSADGAAEVDWSAPTNGAPPADGAGAAAKRPAARARWRRSPPTAPPGRRARPTAPPTGSRVARREAGEATTAHRLSSSLISQARQGDVATDAEGAVVADARRPKACRSARPGIARDFLRSDLASATWRGPPTRRRRGRRCRPDVPYEFGVSGRVARAVAAMVDRPPSPRRRRSPRTARTSAPAAPRCRLLRTVSTNGASRSSSSSSAAAARPAARAFCARCWR